MSKPRSARDDQLARLLARVADPEDELRRFTLRSDAQGDWADLFYGDNPECLHTMAILRDDSP